MPQLKHGHTRRDPSGGPRKVTPEWRAYHAMKTRVLNPNQPRFKDYGGRGITICLRWLDPETGFQAFLDDMGPKPPGTSLDRIDNSQGYEPGNCRWATPQEQHRNQRNNRIVEIGGQAMTVAEAIERFATVAPGTVRMRLHRGQSIEDALGITRAADRLTLVM